MKRFGKFSDDWFYLFPVTSFYWASERKDSHISIATQARNKQRNCGAQHDKIDA
ncbi:hypothetical protein AB0I77_15700 [Streptomyces sp. NPDC050619]|uniref:hypothetical protein n=1 Tax=Streptomyces sp. NPDC050619 TaxID=3157214 RepID=UPI003414C23C